LLGSDQTPHPAVAVVKAVMQPVQVEALESKASVWQHVSDALAVTTLNVDSNSDKETVITVEGTSSMPTRRVIDSG